MVEIVRIKDPDQRAWAERQASGGISRYEKKALDYALADDFNIYEAAQLSKKRLQYEDLWLFAAHPEIYALAKAYLDKQFGTTWGDRTGLSRHIPGLIYWLVRLGIPQYKIGDGSSSHHAIVPAVRYLTPFSLASRVGFESSDGFREQLKRRDDSCGVRLFVSGETLMIDVVKRLADVPGARLRETKSTVSARVMGKETRGFDKGEIAPVVAGMRQSYVDATPDNLTYHGIHVYLAGERGIGLPNRDGRVQVQLLFQAAARMRVITSAALRCRGTADLGLPEGSLDGLVKRTVLEFSHGG